MIRIEGLLSCTSLRVEPDTSKPHCLRQEMGTSFVVAPHPGTYPESRRGFGLRHVVRGSPRAQPRSSLFERKAPKRVGGDFQVVGPMTAPAPFADGHLAEQIIIIPQRREDRIIRKELRHINNAFCSTLPRNHEAAIAFSADGSD